MTEKTRYDEFVDKAIANKQIYVDDLQGNGSFSYVEQVLELTELSNKLNLNLFQYLFGERLGEHLAEKYVYECDRNLLNLMCRMDSQYRFFMLHELKTNKELFAYC